MSNISNVCVLPIEKSKFLKPSSIHYTRGDKKMKWDFVRCHDCVAVIIFNTTRRVLICVKQLRPTVYIQQIPEKEWKNIDTRKYPLDMGINVEFCAGIVDRDKSMEEIAKSEVLQETGYDIPIEKLQKVKTLRSTGVALYDVHLYYVEVEDVMRTSKGGGLANEGEQIDIVELSLSEVVKIINDRQAVYHFAFVFGLTWFWYRKLKREL